METIIQGKILYTVGDRYSKLIESYLKGYTIVHYYTDYPVIKEYMERFESFLRDENERIPLTMKVEEEVLSRDHIFYEQFENDHSINDVIYKVIATPNIFSNQDALFVLNKE